VNTELFWPGGSGPYSSSICLFEDPWHRYHPGALGLEGRPGVSGAAPNHALQRTGLPTFELTL
jgi:hypothetical protein